MAIMRAETVKVWGLALRLACLLPSPHPKHLPKCFKLDTLGSRRGFSSEPLVSLQRSPCLQENYYLGNLIQAYVLDIKK